MKIHISLSAPPEVKYAMVNRPVGISCNPKDGFIRSEDRPARGKPHYATARNGVAVYNRILTDHETKQFEMARMLDGAEIAELVNLVTAELSEYAEGYLDMHEDDPRDFEQLVMQAIKDVSKGYPPSIDDMQNFVELIVKHLKGKK